MARRTAEVKRRDALIQEIGDRETQAKAALAAGQDELAAEIGAKPRIWPLLRHPRLLYDLHAGPFCGVQFRLTGPGARFDMAKRVLAHAKSPVHAFRILDFALAEAARMLGVRRYRARLSLFGRIRKPDQEHIV